MILRLRRAVGRDRDLLLLLWALVVLQPLVPSDHPLGRADLAPWLTLCLVGLALLRGAPLGAGPHPMLRPRRSRVGAALRRLGLALIPVALLGLYDAGAGLAEEAVALRLARGLLPAGPDSAVAGVLLAGLSALALHLGRQQGETAWQSPGARRSSRLGWLGPTLAAGGLTLLAGLLGRWSSPLLGGLGPGLLLGTGLASVGLAAGRPVHLAQRRATRAPGARPDPLLRFHLALAFLGPAVVLTLLSALGSSLSSTGLQPYTTSAGFSRAFLGALLVVAWGAVLWPRPRPRERLCLLREVVPAGGRDTRGGDRAPGFDETPEGALRLDPLRVRPTRRVHAWRVPLRDDRIGAADDPVRPLWTPPPRPGAAHALGRASFLPTPHDHRMEIELQAGEATTRLREGEVQARAMVVLRELPALGDSRRPAPGSWIWERALPAVCRQDVDATTRRLALEQDHILVLSSEGVARAFQVEVGEALEADRFPPGLRLPQVEDYIAMGEG